MAETASSLAQRARRIALIEAIRGRPDLTISQLQRLFDSSPYGDELRRITIRDLVSSQPSHPALAAHRGESIEQAILRVFARVPGQRLASGFFCRYMGLERWTAQKVLAEMAERGLLVRSGKTSGTRYCLPAKVERRGGGARTQAERGRGRGRVVSRARDEPERHELTRPASRAS